jgi:hypothetical protein
MSKLRHFVPVADPRHAWVETRLSMYFQREENGPRSGHAALIASKNGGGITVRAPDAWITDNALRAATQHDRTGIALEKTPTLQRAVLKAFYGTHPWPGAAKDRDTWSRVSPPPCVRQHFGDRLAHVALLMPSLIEMCFTITPCGAVAVEPPLMLEVTCDKAIRQRDRIRSDAIKEWTQALATVSRLLGGCERPPRRVHVLTWKA